MTADDARYVFDRLDMGHVRQCAANARSHWEHGHLPVEVCYQPGDGTHYALLLVPIDARLPVVGGPGGGTGGNPPHHGWGGVLKENPDRMFVYWIQRGEGLHFGYGEYLDPSWLADHFATTGASILALAVLLNLVSSGSEAWIEKFLERIPETEEEVA